MGGDVNFSAFSGSAATITNGAGTGRSGWIDLGGGTRAFNVASGVGLFVEVPVANGGLAKTGSGTMHLDSANTYSGGTTISAGTLEGGVAGSIPGNVTNSAGTLKLDNASAMASGATLALASSPGAGAVNLNFSGTQTINALYFGTTQKAAGTWGASGASHTNAAFTGSGILNVTTGPALDHRRQPDLRLQSLHLRQFPDLHRHRHRQFTQRHGPIQSGRRSLGQPRHPGRWLQRPWSSAPSRSPAARIRLPLTTAAMITTTPATARPARSRRPSRPSR